MTELNELIVEKSLRIENGIVKMYGKIDYIMFPAPAIAHFWQKIGEDFGDEYLFDMGYEAGADGANEMIEKLGLLYKTIPKNLGIILKMFETLGFGEMDLKIFNPKEGKSLIHVRNHPVIKYAKKAFHEKSHICALYRGIFSIHGEKELKIKNCKLKETQCLCKGAKFCEWSTGVL